MRKAIFALIIASISLVACNNTKKENKESKAPADLTETISPQIIAQYAGTYVGKIPCASCPGINTSVVLKDDQTFEYTSEYIDETDGTFKETGKYIIRGNMIVLKIDDDKNVYLKPEKDKMRFLGKNKQEIIGELADNYLLTKATGKQIYTFKNDKNETIKVSYFDENGKMFVKLDKDGEPAVKLEQTTAWAKGAEYGKENTQWHAKGEKATLIIDGKKQEFTQIN